MCLFLSFSHHFKIMLIISIMYIYIYIYIYPGEKYAINENNYLNIS